MKAKTMVTVALLGFVAASVGFLAWQETGGTASNAPQTPPTAPAAANDAEAAAPASGTAIPDGLVAYYFHGTKRCNTCRAIQANAIEAINGGFPEALLQGTLRFEEVDLDTPENGHFATDFDVTGSSLVLAEYRDGKPARFKNLQKVWELYANKDAFAAYVRDETRAWLEGGQ